MSSEKRLVLFVVLAIGSMYGMTILMDALGLNPPPAKPNPAVVAKDQEKPKPAEKPAPDAVAQARDAAMPADPFLKDEPAKPVAAKSDRVTQPLVLGAGKGGADGYRLEIRLDQRGASVASAISTIYEGRDTTATRPSKVG